MTAIVFIDKQLHHVQLTVLSQKMNQGLLLIVENDFGEVYFPLVEDDLELLLPIEHYRVDEVLQADVHSFGILTNTFSRL